MPRKADEDTRDASPVAPGEFMDEDEVELRTRDELAGMQMGSKSHEQPRQFRWTARGRAIQVIGGVAVVLALAVAVASVITAGSERLKHLDPCPGPDDASAHNGNLPSDTSKTLPNWQGPSTENWRGHANDDWRGFSMLRGGKGYASTPMGQVHYRDVGPRDCKHPIVLLHQSPLSMIQFADVQNQLAAMGIRAITVDTPGHGMSDLPPQQPTIPEFADNLVPVLDHLNLDRVVVAGHHTGAKIAASFAARHKSRVCGVLLHTLTLRTAEEIAEWEAGDNRGRPRTPVYDGSHLAQSFSFTSESSSPELLEALTYLVIAKFQIGPDVGFYAAYRHVSAPELAAIRVPGVLLYDATDAYANVLRAHEARPDFKFVEFSNATSGFGFLSLDLAPERWARIAAEFVRSLPD